MRFSVSWHAPTSMDAQTSVESLQHGKCDSGSIRPIGMMKALEVLIIELFSIYKWLSMSHLCAKARHFPMKSKLAIRLKMAGRRGLAPF